MCYYNIYQIGVLDVKHWWQLGLMLSDAETKSSANIDDQMENTNPKNSSVKISKETKKLQNEKYIIDKTEEYAG